MSEKIQLVSRERPPELSPEDAPGLLGLATADLSPGNQTFYDRITRNLLGSVEWAGRKPRECHDLLALMDRAPRFQVEVLDPRTDLKGLLRLRCPVPCLPPGAKELEVATEALLVLTYPHQVLFEPLPGFIFIDILEPEHVWLSNVTYGTPVQKLCLGTTMPVGIRTVELVLAAYASLTLQTAQVDEQDRAGIFNKDAAHWYQRNMDRIPLSRVPFFGDEDLREGEDHE